MNFAQAMETAKRIDEMAVELKARMLDAVADLPFNGYYINDGKTGGPVIAIVKLSALASNWSPSYHLPAEQSRLVAKRLAKCESAAAIISAVDSMLTSGCVKLENGDKEYLNDQTYKTILDSELGQHIAKETEFALLRFFAEYVILCNVNAREGLERETTEQE